MNMAKKYLTVTEHEFKIVYDNFMDCLNRRNDSVEDFKTLLFQGFIADIALQLKRAQGFQSFDYDAFLCHTFTEFSATLERIVSEVKK